MQLHCPSSTVYRVTRTGGFGQVLGVGPIERSSGTFDNGIRHTWFCQEILQALKRHCPSPCGIWCRSWWWNLILRRWSRSVGRGHGQFDRGLIWSANSGTWRYTMNPLFYSRFGTELRFPIIPSEGAPLNKSNLSLEVCFPDSWTERKKSGNLSNWTNRSW